MGAVMNGLALHGGVLPVGGTFFVFSDYMRPAVRLAALSEAHVIYSWTHDSVGLGEDGPTHQPVEQIAAMRAMPGLRVIRPADANETAHAWRIAVDSGGPTALLLSRQGVPILEGTADAADGVARGRLRPRRRTRRDTRGRPGGHRQRGPSVRGGRRRAGRWSRRRAGPGGLVAVVGAVRRAGRGLPDDGPAPGRPHPGRGGGLAPSGGTATPTTPSRSTISAPRPPVVRFWPVSGTPRTTWWPVPGRCSRQGGSHDDTAGSPRATGPEPVARQPPP